MELDFEKVENQRQLLYEDNKKLKDQQNENLLSLQSLRSQHDNLLNREDRLEDTLAKKTARCDEAEKNAETNAKMVDRLNKQIDHLENELEKTKNDKREVQNELDSIKNQLSDLMI